jgi:protein-L-isoaspartate(D-aspartate) O-methyltransferase
MNGQPDGNVCVKALMNAVLKSFHVCRRYTVIVLTLFAMVAGCHARESEEVTLMKAKEYMISSDLLGRGIQNANVLDAMRNVDRHEFVPEELKRQAYGDHPLPIGSGQTISQPYIVAAMTELIDPQPDHVVLEVGTGSGYQAAVLSGLVRDVYTVEIIPELGETSAALLRRLGYTNVHVRVGDGYAGWPEHAPFDSIIVTCGAGEVPPPLIEQLKPGGIMVIPVGPFLNSQELLVVKKEPDGTISRRSVMAVRFVPMTGER